MEPKIRLSSVPTPEQLLAVANRIGPEKVHVVVFSDSEYAEGFPPTNAKQLISWLEEKLEGIEPEYRVSAELNFAIEFEESITAELSYFRPETETEFAQRVHEIAMREVHSEQQQQRLYESLRQKFEGNT